MPARRSPAPAQQAARRNTGRRMAATPAREVALEVLRAVADRGAYANLLLPSLLGERGLHGRDAALATELAYGTLRGRGTYDAVLAACGAILVASNWCVPSRRTSSRGGSMSARARVLHAASTAS